jgi:hypothetical protein
MGCGPKDTLGRNWGWYGSMKIRLSKHVGVVLEPSRNGFDAGGSAFGCVLQEYFATGQYYFYYTGSTDTGWRKASIGIATTKDGIRFVKHDENPVLSIGRQSVTPAVFKAHGKYWMVFAYSNGFLHRRSLALAVADAPLGPWKFVNRLIEPHNSWEADSIDIGPSVVSLSDDEHLIYYSNVTSGRISRFFQEWKHLRRRIGILRIRISKSGSVLCERWDRNPLAQLNGEPGAWNESLFCPGHIELNGVHYLFPAASTYSIGRPYKQYVGLIEDFSVFFQNPTSKVLIDGPAEKKVIMPNTESEIALDTPFPLKKSNEIWLYYACMDRTDGIWKTALSIFSID